jgi:hypothetical protein
MSIYQPLQRADGRWDYTCTNDAGTFPIGYCTENIYALPWERLPVILQYAYGDEIRWNQEQAKHLPRAENYHTEGHATAEEAIACYRRHEVLELTRKYEDSHSQERCHVCSEWTQQRVEIGTFGHYAICPFCQTVENFLLLHVPPCPKDVLAAEGA